MKLLLSINVWNNQQHGDWQLFISSSATIWNARLRRRDLKPLNQTSRKDPATCIILLLRSPVTSDKVFVGRGLTALLNVKHTALKSCCWKMEWSPFKSGLSFVVPAVSSLVKTSPNTPFILFFAFWELHQNCTYFRNVLSFVGKINRWVFMVDD